MEEEGRFAQENQCSKQNSDLQQVCQFNDLTSQLIKCGQILMHKTGKKRGQENILEILFIVNSRPLAFFNMNPCPKSSYKKF